MEQDIIISSDADDICPGMKRSARAKDKHDQAEQYMEIDSPGFRSAYEEKAYYETKRNFKELIVYAIFVLIATIVAFGHIHPTMYYMTRSMAAAIINREFEAESGTITFRTCATVDDFWRFLLVALPHGLYGYANFDEHLNLHEPTNDKPVPVTNLPTTPPTTTSPFTPTLAPIPGPEGNVSVPPPVTIPLPPLGQQDPVNKTRWYLENGLTLSNLSGAVLGENLLLGRIRLRQLKVRGDTCPIHKHFKRYFKECYSYFSPANEDKESFGPADGPAWHHNPSLGGSVHWGLVGGMYSGGGFAAELPAEDPEAAQYLLEDLHQDGWITRGTRVVFIDFVTYNANVNLFCTVKLVFEFPPTGGVVPSAHIRSQHLLRMMGACDYLLLICEGAYYVFIVFFTLIEFRQMARVGCKRYWKSFWSYITWTILILSYLSLFFNIYCYLKLAGNVSKIEPNRNIYVNFEYLSYWQVQYINALAIGVFFIWLKLFKYLNFNKTMRQLSRTLRRCAKDIAGFAVMFFIVFLAFALLGYLLFGTTAKAYRSFGASVFTLLTTILGEFDYEQIEQANRMLGPIYFLSYIFFVFFVLLNMFLAIVNDTYSEVKRETSTGDQHNLGTFFKRRAGRLWRLFGRKGKKGVKEDRSLEEQERDTYEQIRKALELCNFTELEIEMFFAKYDIDGERRIDEREKQKILDYLQGREFRVAPSYPDDKQVSRDDVVKIDQFSGLQNRLGAVEESIDGIMQRVAHIAQKVESISSAVVSKNLASRQY